MTPESLDYRALSLIDRLTCGIDEHHGVGFMSAAVYDTAWVSLVSKRIENSRVWLFPQCFKYLLDQQAVDGSWTAYASQIDGILNTAASLLSLSKHLVDPLQIRDVSIQDLTDRVSRATAALQTLLDSWDVVATVHVGFEILVPAMLDLLQEQSITFDFPGRDTLMAINRQKLQKLKPEYLYGKVQLTALHSLEAFIGKIDFEGVSHHKVKGSFMASPSSTAAFMMNAREWHDDCEDYLRHVIAYGDGARTGGIPSAFPSTIFETTWAVSTLLEGGFDLNSLSPYHSSKVASFLSRCMVEGNGIVGFGLGADADDTSKTIFILNQLGRPTNPRPLMHGFEADHYFKTYPFERNPSFSANCNVLIALLHVEQPAQYSLQIGKVAKFLLSRWCDEGLGIRDKWAMSRLLKLCQTGALPELAEDIEAQVIGLLVDVGHHILNSSNGNGSWGVQNSSEETAYAILALLGSVGFHVSREFEEQARLIVAQGKAFLAATGSTKPDHLWVEKVTYASKILLECYVLAALKLEFPTSQWKAIERVSATPLNALQTEQTSEKGHTVGISSADGYSIIDASTIKLDQESHLSNGHSTNGHSTNGDSTNGHSTNGCSTNSHSINGHSTDSHSINGQSADDQHANGLSAHYHTTDRQSQQCGTTQLNGHSNGVRVLSNGSAMVDQTHRSVTNPDRLWSGACIPAWNEQKEEILLGPFHYLEKQPGKDMRSLLISGFNDWLNVPPERLAIIERVIKMLHTASLLVDDIEDNSDLRRGIPVAHSIFGVPQTFNSGNYVYFLALQEVRKLNNPTAIDIFIEELINLHRGQGLDLFWRDSLTCPSENEYLEMVANKTGGLFSLAIRLMEAESPTTRSFAPLVTVLGLQFQICDDYLNLQSTTYTKQKGLCEDITEGKFSFPIIHSIRSNPNNRELINILKQKTKDADVKKYALQYMQSTGSFEYTRAVVAELKAKALDLIADYEARGWGDGMIIRKLIARMDLA